MKFCIACLATIGLAVWSVGCGSQTTTTTPDPAVDTDLGSPGGMEGGTTTGGMAPAGEDTGSSEEEGATGGPELP